MRCSLNPKAQALNNAQGQLRPEPYFPILFKSHEMEFKEFKSRFKSAKTRFKLSSGLNLETFDTILSETNHI